MQHYRSENYRILHEHDKRGSLKKRNNIEIVYRPNNGETVLLSRVVSNVPIGKRLSNVLATCSEIHVSVRTLLFHSCFGNMLRSSRVIN